LATAIRKYKKQGIVTDQTPHHVGMKINKMEAENWKASVRQDKGS